MVPEHLTVCLENVMEPDASMLLGIVRQVNDARLRICLDLGHANTSASRETPADWLKACAPYLSHVHLHNNDGIHDLHAPLFEGVMDIAALLKQLNALCPGRKRDTGALFVPEIGRMACPAESFGGITHDRIGANITGKPFPDHGP